MRRSTDTSEGRIAPRLGLGLPLRSTAIAGHRLRLVFAVCLVVLGACGDDGARMSFDAGVRRDASFQWDASFASDAGSGIPEDAGIPAVPDAGPMMCPGECDPVAVQGCADGVCILAGDAPYCVPQAGRLEEGSACEEPGQCAPGLACFRRPSGGVCAPVCCFGDESCGDGRTCRGPGVLIDGSESAFGQCRAPIACDPLEAESCEPGMACRIVSPEGDTDCVRLGEAAVGEACVAQSDCQGGLFCGGLFERVCVRICSLAEDGGCPDGEGICQGYAHTPEGVGLCTMETMRSRP